MKDNEKDLLDQNKNQSDNNHEILGKKIDNESFEDKMSNFVKPKSEQRSFSEKMSENINVVKKEFTVTINDLMEVSAQFGHKPSITHPSMKRREYIFGEIKNIAILNLDKTIVLLESACKYLESVAAKGGKFLFVGIRKNIQEEVAECAKKSGSYYVNKRWTPGLLTNFNTLKLNLTRRNDLQKSVDKEKNLYTKKEILGMRREIESIDSVYGGLKEIYDLPNCVIILDASCQKIAIEEARKKKIPIVAICDSNCDIKDIDYPIPANDDNKKSVSFIAEVLNDFIINGISLKVQQKNKIHTDEKRTFQRGDNFQNNKLQERIKGGFFQKPRQNQDGLQNTEKTFNKTGEGQSTFFKPRTFTPRTGEGQATFFKPRTFSPRVGEGQQTFFKPRTLTPRTGEGQATFFKPRTFTPRTGESPLNNDSKVTFVKLDNRFSNSKQKYQRVEPSNGSKEIKEEEK